MDLLAMIETRRRSTSVETSEAREKRPVKIAYIMSRFPKITETFILYEILELAKCGVSVEIYPLLRTAEPVRHSEAERLAERAHYHPFLSLPILCAQWYFIGRRPRAYFKTWAEVLRGTFGSANFFIGTLCIFPKVVRFAYEMVHQGITHVHAHFANHPAVAGLIIHRLTGIPFSFTAHGSDLHVERRMLAEKVEAAEFVATISSFNKELMIQECGEGVRQKIHVIPCGVDPDIFTPHYRSDCDDPFTILSVAWFEEVKGHKYLIEACRLLRDRGIDFECRFVGDGRLRREIETQIEQLGLQDAIHLLGPQPRAEVAKMLSEADVMALHSVPTQRGDIEGIPVVLMEAMASEIPVVASRLSGIPELVDHGRTGLLVPPRDTTAIANALHMLWEDRELRCGLGQAGREKVLREFNLKTNAKKLAKLFTPAPRMEPAVVGDERAEHKLPSSRDITDKSSGLQG